jgi:hypothetical protein
LLSFAATREKRGREREREELFLPVLKIHHHHAFVVLQSEQASQLFLLFSRLLSFAATREKREELFLPVLELHHPHFFFSVAIGTSLAAFLLFSR